MNDWDADPVLSDFSSLKITVPFEESDKIRIQIAEEEEPNNSNKESSAAHPLTSELVISDFANSNIKFPEEVMQNRNKNKTNLIVMQNDTPNQIEDSYEIVVVSCNSVNNRNSKVVITPCFPMPGQIITVDKSNIKGTTEKDEVNKTVTSGNIFKLLCWDRTVFLKVGYMYPTRRICKGFVNNFKKFILSDFLIF